MKGNRQAITKEIGEANLKWVKRSQLKRISINTYSVSSLHTYILTKQYMETNLDL